MAKDGVEVEIKIPVSKKIFENVRRFLKKKAKFVSSSSEIDKYFNPTHRSFLKKVHPTEYLRVRFSGSNGSITYKNVYLNKKGERTHSNEHESEVSDPSSVVQILKDLDFDNFLTVEKDREEYIYNNIFEVDLDKVKGLGYFIEVESVANEGGVAAAIKRVRDFAQKLGLNPNKPDMKGYVIALMEKKGLGKSG
jgi:adenylate cyclase, class 2